MTKPAGATDSFVQALNLLQAGAGKGGENHLGNAFAGLDDKRLLAVIDNYHADFSPVVGIYGPGRIDQGDAVVKGQPASRPDLRLEAVRQGYGYSGGHQGPLTGSENKILIIGRVKIHPGGMT